MGWLNQIGGMLQKYSEGSSHSENPEQDFQQVAQHAPPNALSPGLADAFRSNQTPPFGDMLSSMFGQSNGEQRAGILNQLIQAVGPAALGGGLLSKLGGLTGGGVTPQQAEQVSPEEVKGLAEHAEKKDPSIIDQASEFYAQHPTLVQSLGVGALAMIMSRMTRR